MQRGKRGRLYLAREITQPVGSMARNAETKRRFAVCFSICSKNFFSPLSLQHPRQELRAGAGGGRRAAEKRDGLGSVFGFGSA
ncbi:hypothetical protein NL676_020602 [Syzygium grande]|nr:hypothetical protein NL676_020602 [Syzygium grande]